MTDTPVGKQDGDLQPEKVFLRCGNREMDLCPNSIGFYSLASTSKVKEEARRQEEMLWGTWYPRTGLGHHKCPEPRMLSLQNCQEGKDAVVSS